MTAENVSGDSEHSRGDIHHLLGIGNFAVLVLVLLVMVISIVLVIGLRNDVAALEDQARKSTKATKALQDELASLKDLDSRHAIQGGRSRRTLCDNGEQHRRR